MASLRERHELSASVPLTLRRHGGISSGGNLALMRVLHRTISGSELPIAVRTAGVGAGDPNGTPVMLVHGMGGDHATWHGFAKTLRAAGRPVISFDLRGHGRSGHPETYALDSFADDLAFVLDELGVARADVVGHSLGAHTALRFAMAQPERVGSLVLEEVPPMPRDQADLDEDITADSSFGERLRGLGAVVSNPLPLLRFDRRVGAQVGDQFKQADPAWWDRLADVTARTLVISGGPSSFLPSHHLSALSDMLPDSRFATIAAGHSVHRDKPREFNALAADFLTSR